MECTRKQAAGYRKRPLGTQKSASPCWLVWQLVYCYELLSEHDADSECSVWPRPTTQTCRVGYMSDAADERLYFRIMATSRLYLKIGIDILLYCNLRKHLASKTGAQIRMRLLYVVSSHWRYLWQYETFKSRRGSSCSIVHVVGLSCGFWLVLREMSTLQLYALTIIELW